MIPTIILGLIVILIFAFALRGMIKEHQNGGCSGCTSCHGNCPHCAVHFTNQRGVNNETE